MGERGCLQGCTCRDMVTGHTTRDHAAKATADTRHVVAGECTKTVETVEYIKQLRTAVERIDKAIPRTVAVKGTWQEEAKAMGPIGTWCPARRIVVTARAGVERMTEGKRVSDEQWLAMRRVIGGVIPECKAIATMQERRQAQTAQAWRRRIRPGRRDAPRHHPCPDRLRREPQAGAEPGRFRHP